MLTHPERTKEELVAWIRDYFEQNGPACSAVVGISGGKDSSQVQPATAKGAHLRRSAVCLWRDDEVRCDHCLRLFLPAQLWHRERRDDRAGG